MERRNTDADATMRPKNFLLRMKSKNKLMEPKTILRSSTRVMNPSLNGERASVSVEYSGGCLQNQLEKSSFPREESARAEHMFMASSHVSRCPI